MALHSTPVSRRTFLRGVGAAGLSVGVAGMVSGCSSASPSAADFLRRDRYFIAHRGAGDESPEHTLEAYTRILDRGAEGIEISVWRTRDGVLVCHHDPTLERTSDGFAGKISDLTYAELGRHPVDMTRWIGPGWGTQVIPRLDDVLDHVGNRAVLFIEPKDVSAAPDVLRAVTDRKLEKSVVHKQHYSARGDDAARAAGLQVWNYYDATTSAADVTALARRSDALGAESNNEPLDDDRIALARAAVATGKPVIGWVVRRRHEVDALAQLGVHGFMTSSWTYLAKPGPPQTQDTFANRRVEPGDLPPTYEDNTSVVWNSDNSVSLDDGSSPQSLSMGSMCPIAAPAYRIRVEMRFDAVPLDKGQHAGLVIGRQDDMPFRFGLQGPSGGQLVILRGNGSLELRSVPDDNGQSLPEAVVRGQPVIPGRWENLTIDVQADTVEVTRTPTDAAAITARGRRTATGGYFSVTRNYADGPYAGVRFRGIAVTPLT